MNKYDVINGALVADAASMGLHWMYDQAQLQRLSAAGDLLFRHPEPAVYEGQKSYFAHAAKRSGELSHYGESAKVVAQVALADGGYQRLAHEQLFLQTFGPCGSYHGFADRPTKHIVARLLQVGDEAEFAALDDTQMPPLACVPGLYVAKGSVHELSQAVGLLTANNVGLNGAAVVWRCLAELESGVRLPQALRNSANKAEGELRDALLQALDFADGQYQPLQAAEHFGLPCHMIQGLPVCWHLLCHATDYTSLLRDNISCGGDCCGRAMALGAIGGAVFGIPVAMRERVVPPLYGSVAE